LATIAFGGLLILNFTFRYFVKSGLLPADNRALGYIVPDSKHFHQVASEKANCIRKEGWTSFELFPKYLGVGQGIAGVASFFYVLFGNHPDIMVMISCLAQLFSGILLFSFLKKPFGEKSAVFGSLIFVFNPFALEWTANLHRDSFFILGNFLILFALGQAVQPNQANAWRDKTTAVLIFLPLAAGIFLCWIMRTYWPLFISINLLLLLITNLSILARNKIFKTKQQKLQNQLRPILNMGIITVFSVGLFIALKKVYEVPVYENAFVRSVQGVEKPSLHLPVHESKSKMQGCSQTPKDVTNPKQKKLQKIPSVVFDLPLTSILSEGDILGASTLSGGKASVPGKFSFLEPQTRPEAGYSFQKAVFSPADSLKYDRVEFDLQIRVLRKFTFTPWLAQSLQAPFEKIYIWRKSALNLPAGSNLEQESDLASVPSFFVYLPRALCVGFFAPFPADLVQPGSTEVGTLGRRMYLVTWPLYLISLIGFGIWFLQAKDEFPLKNQTLYAVLSVLIFVYLVPNIGTLVRFRAGFFMLIICSGAAYWIKKLFDKQSHQSA